MEFQAMEYTGNMRIYLDLCCLKRPFDGQEQLLVRLQTEAIANILALPNSVAELIRAPAQALENSFNQVAARRKAVEAWLAEVPFVSLREEEMVNRIDELKGIGFKSFDALHLASAELANAKVFLTVDVPLLKLGTRIAVQLRVRVAEPVSFLAEISR